MLVETDAKQPHLPILPRSARIQASRSQLVFLPNPTQHSSNMFQPKNRLLRCLTSAPPYATHPEPLEPSQVSYVAEAPDGLMHGQLSVPIKAGGFHFHDPSQN